MHTVDVVFFENSDFYTPGRAQRTTDKEYTYQSLLALKEGDVVIVPTYGDRFPKLRLAFAMVKRCFISDDESNPTLRYVIQKLDLETYEQMMSAQRDREQALRMIKAAKKRRQQVEEFADAKAFMTDDEQAFITKTLEFEFDEAVVESNEPAGTPA